MNDEQFDDLKQFIAGTVAQSEARLRDEISTAVTSSESRLRSEISTVVTLSESHLRKEMKDGFEGVGETLADINDRLDKRDAEVDQRLTHLEHKAA